MDGSIEPSAANLRYVDAMPMRLTMWMVLLVGLTIGAELRAQTAPPVSPKPAVRDVTVTPPAEAAAVDLPAPRRVIDTLVTGGVTTDTAGRLTEHLWLIRVFDDDQFLLTHRTSADKPDALYRVFVTAGRPVAVSGYANRMYVVYADGSVQSIRYRQTQDPQLMHWCGWMARASPM
jgi:hypothetical protein